MKIRKLLTTSVFIIISTSSYAERMPPRESIIACEGKTMGASCEFKDRQGVMQGTCNDRPGVMACAPDRGRAQESNQRERQQLSNTDERQTGLSEPQYSLKGNGSTQFKLEVWADNWFTAYLGEKLIVEDAVPITTERSFNAETVIFDADYPLQLNFILKDFIENNTGLEYIGQRKQQMGDGGFIMQLTEMNSGEVVSVSDDNLKCKVIHKAPLNKSCARSSSPVAGEPPCNFIALEQPSGWKMPGYNDSEWENASVYSSESVRPKGGYDRINWDANAKFIWGADLETDNTILCRITIKGQNKVTETSSSSASGNSDLHSHFGHFDNVSSREEGNYFRISSNGIANHKMMKGITSWQQQVPLPQDYSGNNSWSIPVNPKIAKNPISTTNHFHKGAVAIAVNGIPMFNALNNRGEFAADVGELDEWGGHSGRADDYHYHLAPEHLEVIVGKGNPIAYALDGFPLYTQTNDKLDKYLGKFNTDGSYQYHAIDYQPYFIAGLRGEVQTDSASNAPEDQIVPQARTIPVRTKQYGPLAGASITNLTKTGTNAYSLEYAINKQKRYVNYSWDQNGLFTFAFIDANGNKTTETYQKNARSNNQPPQRANSTSNNRSGNGQRKYCGDGICDGTESSARCSIDCS